MANQAVSSSFSFGPQEHRLESQAEEEDLLTRSKQQQEFTQKQLAEQQQNIVELQQRMAEINDMMRTFFKTKNPMIHGEREWEAQEPRRICTRGVTLDFPHFEGSNPAEWIFKATQYFDFHQIEGAHRLFMASYHMKGEAFIWYQDAWSNRQFMDWETFARALYIRFGPTTYNDPMEMLTRLKQSSSVRAYKAQFEFLSNRLTSLLDGHQLSCFISGLKDEIRLPVKMFNPESLDTAFELAKIEEEYLASIRRQPKQEGENSSLPTLGTMNHENHEEANRWVKPTGPVRLITSWQMDEKRKRGLCYHCEEKWDPAHICKTPKIYLLHGYEEVKDEVVVEPIEEPKQKTRLKVDPSAKLAERVASGKVVKSEGYCETVPIRIQGITVKARTHCDHLDALSSDLAHIPSPDTPCRRCQHPTQNWLCLSCKEVLCSRYVNKHMLQHYQQTNHCLALSYSDLSIWCHSCYAYLDAKMIQQLRSVHEIAYILKFGQAPPF